MLPPDTSNNSSAINMVLIWFSTAISAISLNEWVAIFTIVYTALQIFIGLRKLLKGQA